MSDTTHETTWEEVRSAFADRARDNFLNQEMTAMGVEVEMAHLRDDLTSPPAAVYMQAIEDLADRMADDDRVSVKVEEDVPGDRIIGVETGDVPGPVGAVWDFDYSNEAELGTGIAHGLREVHAQRQWMQDEFVESLPEGALYRIGTVPGLMVPEVDDVYDWDELDGDALPEEHRSPKRRYDDHDDTWDVGLVGGTDSTQLTMRPYLPEDAGPEDVDQMVARFLGGEEAPGIPALSPLFFAPGVNSPRFDAEGEMETRMARLDAYRQEFDSFAEYDEHPFTSGGMDTKHGYMRDWAEKDGGIDGLEDAIEVIADRVTQFSAGVPARRLMTEDGRLDEQYDHLDPDTPVNVRVGDHDDTYTFRDIVTEQGFEGQATIEDADGERTPEWVAVDYSDLKGEEFIDTMWEQFDAHGGGVWPNYRPRFEAGAFESRDHCTSEYEREMIDVQAGVFMQWQELQQYAQEELGLEESDAERLRDGVKDEGLEYELPDGRTVRDAWLEDDGLLDRVTEGVAVAEDPEYAMAFRRRMREHLEEGAPADRRHEDYQEADIETAMEPTRVNGTPYRVE